jgi:hypothetical protein
MRFTTLRRIISVLVIGVLAVSLASLHVERTQLQTYLSSLKQKYNPESGSFYASVLLEVFAEEHDKLLVFNDEYLGRIAPDIADGITTEALTQLREKAILVSRNNQELFLDEINYKLFGAPPAITTIYDNIIHTQWESTTRQQSLEAAVVAWEYEFAAEQARIVAEEARKAAELEAARVVEIKRAAEQAAADNLAKEKKAAEEFLKTLEVEIPVVVVTPKPIPAPESAEARLNRISSTLPFSTLPVIIGNCDATGESLAVACYTLGDDVVVVVVPSYVNRSECKIRKVIAHENRHHWQYLNGKMLFDAHWKITNAPELEVDAYAFGARYGC